MRTAAREIALQIAQRDYSKEVVEEGQLIRFWWRESLMQSGVYYAEGFLLVTRSWCHHEGIWCFPRYKEMQWLGSWNQFLKTSLQRPTPPVSLKHRVTHSPLWIPCSGCSRLAAAAAQSSLSTEVDGNCPCCSVAGRCSWQVPVWSYTPYATDHSLLNCFYWLRSL